MKKKVLAIILTLALGLGVITAVSAEPPAPKEATGRGSITFEENVFEIIEPDDNPDDEEECKCCGDTGICPDEHDDDCETDCDCSTKDEDTPCCCCDFDDPAGPIVDNDTGKVTASSKHIGFGVRTRTSRVVQYSSLDGGVGIERDQRVIGVAIEAPEEFTLSVQIGDFYVGSGTDIKSMENFSLTLSKAGADTNYDGENAFTQKTVTIEPNKSAADIFTSKEDSFGIFAGHWSGELLVHPDKITEAGLGQMGQAKITWILTLGEVGD
jgi:hypothetical protein